jgi:hypothetical protein
VALFLSGFILFSATNLVPRIERYRHEPDSAITDCHSLIAADFSGPRFFHRIS